MPSDQSIADTEQCELCEVTTETWAEMLTHLESEHPELWEERWDDYEEKTDELWDGLLTAYAAGFSKAAETFGADPDFDTNVRSLKQNGALTESHYYFWDGRTLPLQFWIREQFGLDSTTDDGRNNRDLQPDTGQEVGDDA